MHNLSRRTAFRLVLLVAAFPLMTSIPSLPPDTPLAIRATIRSPISPWKAHARVPEFEYQWDEHRYRFASAEHRDLFKADPVRYAPQFGNYCAMALAMGKIVKAESGKLADQRRQALCLRHARTEGPELFQKDLAGNIIKANQNRPILPKD